MVKGKDNVKQIKEIESLIKEMFVDLEEFTKSDEVYKEDMKDSGFRIQWKICGFDGYQIFEKDNYEHKFGGILTDPDFSLTIRNVESALKFLKGEIIGLRYAARKSYNGRFKLIHRLGWKTIKTESGEKKKTFRKVFSNS